MNKFSQVATRFPFKKIDWYILSEFISPFLGGIVFFIFIFLMAQFLRLAELLIVHGASLLSLMELMSYLIVSFLPIALPLAFLIGILVAFGRLSSDSELVAMKASGLSLSRLARPILASAIVVLGICLALNLEWVPQSERSFKSTLIKISNTKVVSALREGTFTFGFFDLLVFADRIDADTNRLYRVFVFDERDPKNPLAVIAREGQVITLKSENDMTSAAFLKLFHGNIHRNDIANLTYQKIEFGEYRLFLKIDEGTTTASEKPKMLTYKDLRRRIRAAKDHPDYFLELVSEFWRRFAVALSPIGFVFLGIGFGTTRARSVRASAALISLGTIVYYWGAMAVVTSLVQNRILAPWFGPFIPPFLIIALGVWAFRRSSW